MLLAAIVLFSTAFIAPDGTLLTDYNPAIFQNVQGFMEIHGNAAANSGDNVTDCVAVDLAFPADQWAEGELAAVGAGIFAGIAVRAGAAGSQTFYNYFGNDSVSYLTKWLAGAFTVLGTGGPFAGGDIARLEAIGNVLTPKLNGASDIAPAVDGDIAAGRGALSAYSAVPDWTTGILNFSTGYFGADAPGVWLSHFIPGL